MNSRKHAIPLARYGHIAYNVTPYLQRAFMEKNQTNTIVSYSFELALKELESIVRKLESGSGDLEASIADYVRGTELKEYCQKKLADARLQVESILKAPDGTLHTQPFDAQ